MWTQRHIALLCLFLASCFLDPHGPTLTGSWGGSGFRIDATTDGANVRFYCAWGETGPLRITQPGRAAADGRHFTFVNPNVVMNPLWLEAQEAGDTLVVTTYVAVHDAAHSATFTVLRNGQSDAGAAMCLQ
jgi:hypothetical protein